MKTILKVTWLLCTSVWTSEDAAMNTHLDSRGLQHTYDQSLQITLLFFMWTQILFRFSFSFKWFKKWCGRCNWKKLLDISKLISFFASIIGLCILAIPKKQHIEISGVHYYFIQDLFEGNMVKVELYNSGSDWGFLHQTTRSK